MGLVLLIDGGIIEDGAGAGSENEGCHSEDDEEKFPHVDWGFEGEYHA